MAAPSHPIRFGVFTGVAQTTWRDLLGVWERIDEMGFDTGWVPDHFYAGYGDPTGATGMLSPPDSTISTEAGRGAGRLALLSDNGQTFRVKVTSYVEDDAIPPDPITTPIVDELAASRASVSFFAPGDDGREGRVSSYEVRYRVPGGRLVNRLLVRPDLERIFDYRRDRIGELLGR